MHLILYSHFPQTLTVEENRLQSVDSSIAGLKNLQLLRLRKNQLSHDAVNDFLGEYPALSDSLKVGRAL